MRAPILAVLVLGLLAAPAPGAGTREEMATTLGQMQAAGMKGDKAAVNRLMKRAFVLADEAWRARDIQTARRVYDGMAMKLRQEVGSGLLPESIPREQVRSTTKIMARALVGRIVSPIRGQGPTASAETVLVDFTFLARRSPDPAEALRHFVRTTIEEAGPDVGKVLGHLQRKGVKTPFSLVPDDADATRARVKALVYAELVRGYRKFARSMTPAVLLTMKARREAAAVVKKLGESSKKAMLVLSFQLAEDYYTARHRKDAKATARAEADLRKLWKRYHSLYGKFSTPLVLEEAMSELSVAAGKTPARIYRSKQDLKDLERPMKQP